MTKPAIITAEFLWRHHREALGGHAAITGASLPETLDECNAGVQGAHWGMALAVSLALHQQEPPLPAKVSPEEASKIRGSIGICSAAE